LFIYIYENTHMQISKVIFPFALALSASLLGNAQEISTPIPPADTKGASLLANVTVYAGEVSKKSQRITKKLLATNEKMLRNYAKEEARFRKMLAKADSIKNGSFLSILDDRRNLASSVLANPAKANTKYLSLIDSALGVLKISQKYSSLLNEKIDLSSVSEAIGNTELLQEQFNKSEMLLWHLRESSSLISDRVRGLKLPVDINRITSSVTKYDQRINEYVGLLNNRKKVEQKVLQAAANTKIFKDFMQKNSILSSMFRMPADGEDEQGFENPEGLQTRESVSAGISEKLGKVSSNVHVNGSKEFEGGRSKLAEEKSKYLFDMMRSGNNAGISSESPSSSKVPLKKRFTFDLNFQTHRQSVITTDLGLAVGYKLNPRSTVGIGAAYKLGLGKSIEHLSLSHQGVSLRSFIDWKVKNGLSITGGYEMNLIDAIRKIDQLKNMSAWQQSGLVGLTKTIVNGPGILKSTKLQILWDFLSYQQIPRAQALVFRVGYGF